MKYFQTVIFSTLFYCSMVAQENLLQIIEGNGVLGEVGLFIDNAGTNGLAIVNCHRSAAFFATRSNSVQPAIVIEQKNGTGDYADIRLDGSHIIKSFNDLYMDIGNSSGEEPHIFGVIQGDKSNPVFFVDESGRVVADGNISGKQIIAGNVNDAQPDLLLSGSNSIISNNAFNGEMKIESTGDILFRIGKTNGSGIAKFSILDNTFEEAFSVDEIGNTRVYGTLVTSDRNKKENILEVSPKSILKDLVDMPIYKWNYKKKERQHIGPMAQDFLGAFNLGNDETTISSIDSDGISLSAIIGLYELTLEELVKRDSLIERLSARIDVLEKNK